MGTTAHHINDPKWRLWTRGGTRGVFLRNDETKEEIQLPSETLRMLVAEDLRAVRIGWLECAEDWQILGLPEEGKR